MRHKIPEIIKTKSISAPGYCTSIGGSTNFEEITGVNVVEKAGNLLEISINVYIANPTNCVSGEPCGVYDSSPEYVNVWIDWDGDLVWEPHEQVINEKLTGYNNLTYNGTMSAIKTIEIPPTAKRPTWLRANLGWSTDPQDPCRYSWSYGNVVDLQVLGNVRVKNIRATLDIELPEIPDQLWHAEYDKVGNLISEVKGGPVIAGMKNGFFTLPIDLISFPGTLGDDTKTDCDWEVEGTRIKGLAGINGKSGVISIGLPQKIGMYNLKLKFKFKNNLNNLIGKQTVILPLWVSYDKPQIQIKQKWLKKAIEWTQNTQMNTNVEDELAQKIMDGIYSKSGWKYYTYNFAWTKLVEGLETDGGNCHVVANVWDNLLKTLGVGGSNTVTHNGQITNRGFMVKPNFTAFGGLPSAPGNASVDYFAYPTYDRWLFGSHTFGQKGNTYYDPTFNVTGTEKYFHVAHDVLGVTDGITYTNAGGPTIWRDGSKVFEEGWNKYIYKYSSIDKTISNPSIINQDAHFTGTFSESPIDLNGDDIYDQLAGNIGIEITNPGNYLVTGSLRKDEKFITSQPYYASPVNWSKPIGPQNGFIEIQAVFSGEAIFTQSINGPFIFELSIIDSTGSIADTATFNTSSLNHQQFGELPARINELSENAVDTLGNGLFDIIKINSIITSNFSGFFTAQKTLFTEAGILSSESENVILNAGSNSLVTSIDIKPISASGLDGPFTLSVQILDESGNQSAYKEIQTANYLASQFNPPQAKITGGNLDEGIDINSNSLFDTLSISLNIEAAESGIYKILAWLKGQNGEDITWSESKTSFGVGSGSVSMNFPGVEINKSQLDGPYKIGYAVISDDSSNIIFSGTDLYMTQNYNYSQFEEAKAQIITFSGNYSESLIDSDNNELIDTLVVALNVTPRDSGNVVALGRLTDSKSETILWASTIEYLNENAPQNIHLKFDGRYIYGNQIDGPFQLSDVQIYHVGDPSQTIDISDPYSTQFYEFEDFEPSAVISGSILDKEPKGVGNAFLIIDDIDNDFSNIDGDYNLVALESGEYLVRIEGPDSLELDWSIYVDGEFALTGDSVLIRAEKGEVKDVDFIASIEITDIDDINSIDKLPKVYSLNQNFPNPFNPTTTISYTLPQKSNVKLRIFNVLGKEIFTLVNSEQIKGTYYVEFDAEGLSSGIYLYKLQAEGFIDTKKMIILK